MNLIRYDAACRALAECKSVDEVKTWADKAAAMQAYGRMAKDKTLEVDAAEIRIRAERRLGEMLSASELQKGGRPPQKTGSSKEPVSSPTLAEAGIDKKLSSRAQKLAAVPQAEFEAEVGQWRERVAEEGKRVSARLQQAGERAQAAAQPDEIAELRNTVGDLAAENERLSDRLAVEAMDASEEEKTSASNIIAELRERVRVLEAEVEALKVSRDTYMRESGEKQKQIAYWRKQAERVAT